MPKFLLIYRNRKSIQIISNIKIYIFNILAQTLASRLVMRFFSRISWKRMQIIEINPKKVPVQWFWLCPTQAAWQWEDLVQVQLRTRDWDEGDSGTDGHLLIYGHVGMLLDGRILQTMWQLLMDIVLTCIFLQGNRKASLEFSLSPKSQLSETRLTCGWNRCDIDSRSCQSPGRQTVSVNTQSTCNTWGQNSLKQEPVALDQKQDQCVWCISLCVSLFFWFRLILCCFVLCFVSFCWGEACIKTE